MSDAAPTLWQRLRYTRLRDAVRGRFDARLDWRRVITESDLRDEVAEVVAQTVQSTRLWRSEKVDVARELIAHFHDGLAAGRTTQQLIESFGDLQQSARLVRRAKKRGRPVLWHVWHYGWLTLASLLVIYILTGLYMLTGRPTIKTDYLAIINERALAVPEAARAWPLYREALLAMGGQVSQPPNKSTPFFVACQAVPGDENWPAAIELLNEHQASVAKLREAAARTELGFAVGPSDAWFDPEDRPLLSNYGSDPSEPEPKVREKLEDRSLVGTLLPQIQLLRWSGGLLAADCRRAASAGEGAVAFADVKALLGVSRHCQETPFLVNLLVARHVRHSAYAVVQAILADHPDLWTDEQLRDLAHLVAASQIDWRRGFEAERISFYDTLQRLYTDDGDGDGRLAYRITSENDFFQVWDKLTGETPQAATSWHDALAVLALPATTMVVESRKEAADTYEQIAGSALAAFETPLWEYEGPWPPDVDDPLNSRGVLDSVRYMMVRMLVPAFDALRLNVVKNDGERDGVLIGIALELYRREHGGWPKTLDELSPRRLPSVPVDRINGGPLGYKIVAGQPLVYSLGSDGVDDGGRSPFARAEYADSYPVQPPHPKADKGDWVIWSTVPPEATPKWESEYMGAEEAGGGENDVPAQ